jgi:hypothetical protein
MCSNRTGRFRWVVCQLNSLGKCRTPAALEEALTRLPKTRNETYDRILGAINESDRRAALSLLQWLAFSRGSLSLAEAVDVIATDPDAKNGPLFDHRRRLWDPRDILDICSSLVTITFREDSSNEGSIGDRDSSRVLSTEPGTIKLAHFSVREYLISEHLHMNTPGLSCYYFNEKIAHVFMAKTCLAYLLQFDQKDDVNSTTLRSHPLARYATENWMDHAG